MVDHLQTKKEYKRLKKLAAKPLCSSLSNYGRNVLLKNPVHIRSHNESPDDFLADRLIFRRELNDIGTDFNQAIHRLHARHIVPEIQHWIIVNE